MLVWDQHRRSCTDRSPRPSKQTPNQKGLATLLTTKLDLGCLIRGGLTEIKREQRFFGSILRRVSYLLSYAALDR